MDAGFFGSSKGQGPGAANFTRLDLLCYKATVTTSAGIWLGDQPLRFPLPLLFAQISIIFASTRITHAILCHLGQPQVVSHIIAGLILGPSFLSRNKEFQQLMFPRRSWIHLNVVSLLAFLLFIFIIAVKTDLSIIRKSGKKAVVLSLSGTICPFFLVLLVAYFIGHFPHNNNRDGRYVGYFSARWAVTSNTVLSCLLDEFHLLTSTLGRLAMSASLLADFFSVVLSSAFLAASLTFSLHSAAEGMLSLAAFAMFLAFIVLVARPLTLRLIQMTPEGSTMDEAHFLTVLLLAVGSSLAGQMIGQQAMVGPLLLGLALPGGPPLGTTLEERLDRLISGVFLPVYMALAGLRADVNSLVDGRQWGHTELLVLASVVGKFAGVFVMGRFFKLPVRDMLAIVLMLNCRGILEIHSASAWEDSQLIDRQLYTAQILAIIAVAGSTAALLKLLYKPSTRFVASKRRTVEHLRENEELRVLSCLHNEDNVPPIINLLEATYPTAVHPVILFLLHLVPLTGHASTSLQSYKPKASSKPASESDRIVNAFRLYERNNPHGITVVPYVSKAPYTTMHDDICSLALDKKAVLVVIPFHRYVAFDGAVETVIPAIRAVNVNVLRYAPCSVGILVDHGLSGGNPAQALPVDLLQNIVVYFLGGPDDREALAFGERMSQNPRVALTVVRFLPEKEATNDEVDEETAIDDRVVNAFRIAHMRSKRVKYREEVVREGAGTVGVIRAMSDDYSLLVVGRRQGKESPLTAGLEMWSEYPELGVIGDLLASTDFVCKVSTLVVQQQTRVGDEVEVEVDSPRSQQGLTGKVGAGVVDESPCEPSQNRWNPPDNGARPPNNL